MGYHYLGREAQSPEQVQQCSEAERSVLFWALNSFTAAQSIPMKATVSAEALGNSFYRLK